jgi:hypothetical protein
MITIISGAPGAGKSSLNAYLLKSTYENDGRTLLACCRERIEEINKTRLNPLTKPDKPPIFSDFNVRFLVDYNQYFEPYYINGYFLGLANDRMPTQFLPPFSKVYLDEAQRYYDSRKTASSFPGFVSRLYEMHRHYGLDITLGVQRVKLIDLNVRENCKHFIEVQSIKHVTDEMGRITSTTWYTREFTSWVEFENYLTTGEKTYTEKEYNNVGNIFDCFDSYNYFQSFIPDEKHNFNYLNFNPEKVSEEDKKFYMAGEPDGYRTKPKETKK